MKSRKSNQNYDRNKSEQIVERLELPKDLFLGMPLFTMEGNHTLWISNHRGIVRYSREEIVVSSRSFGIQITGRELMIPSFTKEILEITGIITSITFLL
jgi:sporulation protein YqfC